MFSAPDSGRVRDDWTFTVSGLFGPVEVPVTVPDGWAVKSIVQSGHVITDTPIEMRSGEQLTGVEVVLTDHVSAIAGHVANSQGAAITDGTVIVFADSPTKWWEESRYVRAVRPDLQGQYEIKGLPPGSYLAVAVDAVEDGMWNDPDYLESIRQYGQKIMLSDGGTYHAIAEHCGTPSLNQSAIVETFRRDDPPRLWVGAAVAQARKRDADLERPAALEHLASGSTGGGAISARGGLNDRDAMAHDTRRRSAGTPGLPAPRSRHAGSRRE